MSDDKRSEKEVEAHRAKTRAGYRKLMDQIADDEDIIVESKDDNNPLLQYLQNNEELYAEVDAPQEAVMDAVVVKHLSRLCKKQAEQMSTNINEFKAEEFATRLKLKMNNENINLNKKRWIAFGNMVKPLFRKSPALTYMYGALDSSPPEPKEKKPRETKSRQADKQSQLKETQAKVVTETEKSVNQTDQIVTHVLSCLVDRWRENDKQAVNYFKFVINPKCFGTSVENMFHASFLIKEGRAGIVTCPETQVPLIYPATKRQMQEAGKLGTRNQVVVSFSMADWAKLIRSHDIKDTMITPP